MELFLIGLPMHMKWHNQIITASLACLIIGDFHAFALDKYNSTFQEYFFMKTAGLCCIFFIYFSTLQLLVALVYFLKHWKPVSFHHMLCECFAPKVVN
jgi:hypothetical protein